MQKQIELRIPTSYEDITLRKWLELQKDLKNYEGDEEATTAVLLLHLCGLSPEYLTGVSVDDYNLLKYELMQFIGKTDLELQRFVKIGDVEYGFEPNLSNMSYGAYADITKFGQITIDENWSKIMNILYRPVEKKLLDTYTISKYEGTKGESKWLDVPMSVHFGALFFLFNLLTDLLSATLKYSMKEEVHPQYKKILERSGEAILQLLSSQMVISPASTLYLKNL
jgi:hypothetical protein